MAPAKTVKALTPYMKHMKECLAKIKADQPGIKHMDAFKLAASGKQNPANPNYTGESWQEICSLHLICT
jgi:CTP:molybdopterin cytidylyltransferase MocA